MRRYITMCATAALAAWFAAPVFAAEESNRVEQLTQQETALAAQLAAVLNETGTPEPALLAGSPGIDEQVVQRGRYYPRYRSSYYRGPYYGPRYRSYPSPYYRPYYRPYYGYGGYGGGIYYGSPGLRIGIGF